MFYAVLGLLILMTVGFVTTALVVSKSDRKTTDVDDSITPSPKKAKSTDSKSLLNSFDWKTTLLVLVGLVALHFLLHKLAPNFWWVWWKQDGFFLFQIFLGLGIYTRSQSSKVLKFFGGLIVLLSLIGIGWTLYNAYTVTSVSDKIVKSLSGSPSGAHLTRNRGTEEIVRKFWNSELAALPAEAMIQISQEESNFNQFEKNANPYRSMPDWHKVGVMQIDDSVWKDKSEELGQDYNLYELKGNLRFALWLFEKEGFTPWTGQSKESLFSLENMKSRLPVLNGERGQKEEEVIALHAEVGVWKVLNLKRPNTIWAPKPVKIAVNGDLDNIIIIGGPVAPPDPKVAVNTIKYKSAGDKPVDFTITYYDK